MLGLSTSGIGWIMFKLKAQQLVQIVGWPICHRAFHSIYSKNNAPWLRFEFWIFCWGSVVVKFFPSTATWPYGGTDLHFLRPQLDTVLHCQAMHMGLWVCAFIVWCACLLPSFWWYSLCISTEEWPGRRSWPGWLVTSPTWLTRLRRQSPFQLLTGLDVK